MSAATMTRVAPILKIRAALRERAAQPARAVANVVSITDALMLNWASEEVLARKDAARALAAVGEELADLRRLVTGLVESEAEVSPLERLLVFTKIESAAGLARQAWQLVALCSLALVLWTAVTPDEEREAMVRAPRGVRVVTARKEGAA